MRREQVVNPDGGAGRSALPFNPKKSRAFCWARLVIGQER
jgi:hypothetical protein